MSTRKITMADIAKRLNISKNAVSLALNGKEGVSGELRQAVIDAASEMGYGRFWARQGGGTRAVAVIIPDYIRNDNFFYTDVFWSIEHEIRLRRHLPLTLTVSKSAEQRLELPMLPAELNIIGLLVVGILSAGYVKALMSLNLPMVTVDITYPEFRLDSVSSANISGAYMAVKHLIDCGHRRIGFVGAIYEAQSVYERWCGYQQALMASGLAADEEAMIVGKRGEFNLLNTAEELLPYYKGVRSMPTAWFCAGDLTASSMMGLLARDGFDIPRDVSVIGYDDLSIASLVSPKLTTVRVDRKLMGKIAVERLIEIVGAPERPRVNIALPASVVSRESVAPPPGLAPGPRE